MKRIIAFVLVGSVGFLADAGALFLLLALTSIGPFYARILSIAFALSLTWLLNRNLTFERSRRRIAVEGARYGGVGLASAIANYAVYSALLLALPGLPPLLSLLAASLAAMALSFIGYSRHVFDR